jgi:phosphoenolpyruvate carboxylase
MIDTLTIALVIALGVSILITFFALWYSIKLSRTLIYFSENMNDLIDMLTVYSNHVKSVYSLESFYGDQVLHNLLKHSQDIVEQLETFDEILYLTEEEGEEMNEQEEQIEQDDTGSWAEAEAQEEAPNPARIRSGL